MGLKLILIFTKRKDKFLNNTLIIQKTIFRFSQKITSITIFSLSKISSQKINLYVYLMTNVILENPQAGSIQK